MYGRNASKFYRGNSPRRSNTMLHITASTKTLREELRIADGLICDIKGALNDVSHQHAPNLTNRIGIFITNMPEFKVLSKDAESAKQLLRKVCSGEIEPREAFLRFDKAQEEIHILINVFDSVTTF